MPYLSQNLLKNNFWYEVNLFKIFFKKIRNTKQLHIKMTGITINLLQLT